MSNTYVSAIERFSALPPGPFTALDPLQTAELETAVEKASLRPRLMTPLARTCHDTPVSAQLTLPQQIDLLYPSTGSPSSPLLAEALDRNFSLSSADTSSAPRWPSIRSSCDDRTPSQRRTAFACSEPLARMPYIHPRSLHSILRNSPLPPSPALPRSSSPRRQCLRLEEKAAKKVEYDSPLEEEITTSKYTKSHIDLLAEDGSPLSPSDALSITERPIVLGIGFSFAKDETQKDGPAAGLLEDMRGKGAGLVAESPIRSNKEIMCANRKRTRREKKRRWVWTIGQDAEDEEYSGGATAALGIPGAVECPGVLVTPSIESSDSLTDASDQDISDSCSMASSEDSQRDRLSVPLEAAGNEISRISRITRTTRTTRTTRRCSRERRKGTCSKRCTNEMHKVMVNK
ncbi:hypothetical protein E4U17_001381 [Claviceps sp. LM77 group G4]|nr:hypothetical protein E4U17_001381 [Claviceps sp. LM77 group G4]KAG6079326.1 hypothetical protein E4U16_001152 [Claviceps sp. LM84 group G4]